MAKAPVLQTGNRRFESSCPYVELEDTVVGKTYKVDATDCCVSVVFTLRLVEKRRDEYQTVEKLIFEHGVEVQWPSHGVHIEQVDT